MTATQPPHTFLRVSCNSSKAMPTLFPLRLILFLFVLALVPGVATAKPAPTSKPATLLRSAEPLVNKFFTAKRWEAVRNLTGIARAVVIIPKGGQAGLIVGGEWGKGFMFIRHGEKWSDPVFVKFGSFQIGLLAGGQSVGLIGALLTKRALDRVLAGKSLLSGSGDFTVGVGLSARAAGGTTGGIEMLSVSKDKGLYFGGSAEDLRIRVDKEMNRLAYGKNFDLNAILHSSNGTYAPARELREKFRKAAHQAVWGE
jgi:lipid-binding SYLF domain-containing protein